MMIRLVAAFGLIAMVAGSSPASALTSKQKMETCTFGADSQKLTGAARKSFITKCMSNADSPRGEPATPAPKQ
jgi:hypothetical protein